MWPYAIRLRRPHRRDAAGFDQRCSCNYDRDFDMAKTGALRVVDCGDHCWRNSFGLPERPARSPLSGWRHMFDAYDEVEVVARATSVGKSSQIALN